MYTSSNWPSGYRLNYPIIVESIAWIFVEKVANRKSLISFKFKQSESFVNNTNNSETKFKS